MPGEHDCDEFALVENLSLMKVKRLAQNAQTGPIGREQLHESEHPVLSYHKVCPHSKVTDAGAVHAAQRYPGLSFESCARAAMNNTGNPTVVQNAATGIENRSRPTRGEQVGQKVVVEAAGVAAKVVATEVVATAAAVGCSII